MRVDQPGRGEELNAGPATTPRPAASVIVLRGGEDALEVLLVRRSPAQRSLGGVWVFPGGALEPADGEGEPGLRSAALRECAEEARVDLSGVGGPPSLTPWSRWITPAQLMIRFDTWFFLATAPPAAAPAVDGRECVDWRWSSPAGALSAHAAGDLLMVFPTVKHLEQLSAFTTAADLLAFVRGRRVEPIEPRMRIEGDAAHVVLPGEPGYDEVLHG